MLNSTYRGGVSIAVKHFAFAAFAGALCFASACSSDSTPNPGSPDSGGGDGGGGSGSGGKAGSSGSGGAAGKAGSSGSAGAAGRAGAAGSSGAAGSGGEDGGACTGAPSKGTNDDAHCKQPDGGAIAQATGACVTGAVDGGEEPVGDAGATSDYGDTLYGTEGDDDDCKYHVKYTVAPICEDEGVTFTVTMTNTADGKPTTGAHPYLELTLNDLPPATSSSQKATEKAGGVYEVGPVVFDKPGKWVARLHFFEECTDSEESPHGHVAFFIDVP